jgi:hypothetical protein
MIKVGQRVRFNPFKGLHLHGSGAIEDEVVGVVHYIHPTNGWFNVKYDGGDGPQLLGFRYDDIGKNVKFVK